MSRSQPEQKVSSREFSLEDALLIGNHLAYLKAAGNNNYRLYSVNSDGIRVLGTFEYIESILVETDIDTVVLTDIRKHRQKLEESYPMEAESDEPVKLDEDDGDSLAEAAKRWAHMIREEVRKEKRVSISNEGLFDSERAMENTEELFSDKAVWEKLPQQTKNDLQEACRALAFDCFTSAVIMALRAVEEQLQTWYKEETKRDIEDRTFGQVLSELDDSFSDDKPPILSHLDYLKDRRNQVAHPERSPGKQEAESTIVMVRETITSIHDKVNEN